MASDFDEKKNRHPINLIGLLPANPDLNVERRQPAIKDVPEKISLSQEHIQLIADKDQPYNNQDDPGNHIDIF
jgi:hypothetical protein